MEQMNLGPAASGGSKFKGPRQRPLLPLRVVHFLKPPALPGDTYYTLMGRTAVDLLCHGFTANNRKVGKHFARTSTGQPNLHILGSRFSTAAIE